MNNLKISIENIADQLDNIAQLYYLKDNSLDNQIGMAYSQLSALVLELTKEVNN